MRTTLYLILTLLYGCGDHLPNPPPPSDPTPDESPLTGDDALPVATPTEIEVRFNVQSQRGGDICLAMFDSAAHYDHSTSDPGNAVAVFRECRPVSTLNWVIRGLRHDQLYGIAAFHDANRNGKLDTGLMGIPQEGYGFSRNPAFRPGRPSWSEIQFTPQEKPRLEIKMIYLF